MKPGQEPDQRDDRQRLRSRRREHARHVLDPELRATAQECEQRQHHLADEVRPHPPRPTTNSCTASPIRAIGLGRATGAAPARGGTASAIASSRRSPSGAPSAVSSAPLARSMAASSNRNAGSTESQRPSLDASTVTCADRSLAPHLAGDGGHVRQRTGQRPVPGQTDDGGIARAALDGRARSCRVGSIAARLTCAWACAQCCARGHRAIALLPRAALC